MSDYIVQNRGTYDEFQQLLESVSEYYGYDSSLDMWESGNFNEVLTPSSIGKALSEKPVPDYRIIVNKKGDIIGYEYYGGLDSKKGSLTYPESSPIESINSNVQTGTNSLANSVKVNIPAEMKTSTSGKLEISSGVGYAKEAGTLNAKTIFNTVSTGVAAVGVGITLGKTVDSILYNANPDFWDEHGMGALNPDTWDSITTDMRDGGVEGAGKRAFNVIFGLNDNNSAQMYMDEQAFAYLTQYMLIANVFGGSSIETLGTLPIPDGMTTPVGLGAGYVVYEPKTGDNRDYAELNVNAKTCVIHCADGYDCIVYASSSPISGYYKIGLDSSSETPINIDTKVTIEGKDVYVGSTYGGYFGGWRNETAHPVNSSTVSTPSSIGGDAMRNLGYYMVYGSVEGIEGIGTYPNAKVPNLNKDDTFDDILRKLKEQYPELWENALENHYYDKDGNERSIKYIPVGMPEAKDKTDLEPTGRQPQNDPTVNPTTSPLPLVESILKLINPQPVDNPDDRGGGKTPESVVPSGTASALWSVYNPTRGELNSLGAWLWSDNFVDQILKLFSNPMEALIGLHKVFASPSIGGRQNIVVGYLDSGVSSNVVSNQYTTVDCGKVNLKEYFGNVFDYAPYTKVQLYLPFIGVVPLEVGDVMRGVIGVKYTVDVLTGVCLAEVSVERDGAGGVLYTYSGDASVHYPLSAGSYMGVVTGALGIAGGIAGTIASGGALAPMLLGGASAIGRMNTNVQHSGALSGNAGAMGIKTPYLIVTRPQTAMADNFEKLVGYPSNKYTIIGACNGFIKVKECHVEYIGNATDEEKSEIESLLKSGVIIK